MAKRVSEERKRIYFCVPESDEVVLLWLGAQESVSTSLRELIRRQALAGGIRDIMSMNLSEFSALSSQMSMGQPAPGRTMMMPAYAQQAYPQPSYPQQTYVLPNVIEDMRQDTKAEDAKGVEEDFANDVVEDVVEPRPRGRRRGKQRTVFGDGAATRPVAESRGEVPMRPVSETQDAQPAQPANLDQSRLDQISAMMGQ